LWLALRLNSLALELNRLAERLAAYAATPQRTERRTPPP
jgi:hypothetical protein